MHSADQKDKKAYLTIEDIAALAGVSKSTVSRVLNNSGFVSDATRKKVMRVVSSHHYVPNGFARDLGRTTTKSIGIFVGDISNQYFSEILAGAEAVISRSAYFPFICLVSNARREEFYIREMLKRRVSGVLFASTGIYNPDMITQLLQTTSAISIQTDIPGIPYIDCDNLGGTYRIIQHLISLGHERIAFINSFGETSVLEHRYQGYCNALSDHGIPLNPQYVRRADRTSNGYQAVIDLLNLPEPPTAIHCCNDHIAMSAYQALRSRGFSIPHQISLTGFDALSPTLLMEPQLTTVSQPLHKMGTTAAEMLIAKIEASQPLPDPSSPILFPTEILLRGSTAPPSVIL